MPGGLNGGGLPCMMNAYNPGSTSSKNSRSASNAGVIVRNSAGVTQRTSDTSPGSGTIVPLPVSVAVHQWRRKVPSAASDCQTLARGRP